MKKLLLALLLVFAAISPALSQGNIKGRITDGEDGPLPSATAMLMNGVDSVLVGFVLTDLEGNFEFKKVLKGNYYVQVTYLQYDMLRIPVEISTGKEEVDLGKVIMTPEGTRLESVEITAEIIPVRIKGDTIEYNAAAFETRPNDNVEQLLKQLPGIEVDGDGNIKAQGETVQKVLVDGKEFFGNDPKMATKNLPANAVDKVQVFEKMSDISEFTGVDDGERTRTINLALKEDHKTGYFGNVGAGYGTKDRFEAKTNLNRFSPKTQISVLGMGNNTNSQPFDVMDYINFMGGISNVMSQGGFGRGGGSSGGLSPSDLGISTWGSNAGLNNNGIATTAAAGLNFNTDIGERWEVSSSYFFNYLQNDIRKEVYRETVTEGQTFTTEEDNVRDDDNYNHRLNLFLKVKIDSLSELIFRGSGKFNDANGNNFLMTASGLEGGLPTTTSDQNYLSLASLLNTDDALTYRRKLNKPGRNFTLQGDFSYQDDGSDVFVDSRNVFTINGNPIADTLDQNQFQDVTSLVYGGRFTYTEPLGKGRFLQGAYRHIENNYYLKKDFFDITESSETFNSSLSNEFESVFRYDRGGLTFQHNKKKYNYSAGVDLQRAILLGDLIAADTSFRKEFVNILPSFRFNYEFRKGRRIRVRYEPSVNAPSITQLQPVVDNSNPLSIYSGNPELRAEYAHNLNTNFIFFDQFSFTSLFAGIRATYTTDKISNATFVDSLFRQFTSPVNVDNDLRLTTFLNFGTPIRKLKVKINLDGNVTWNRGFTFINGISNLTNRLNSYGDFRIENRKKEYFDVKVGTRLTHNITSYEVNSEFDQSFLNATYYADASVNFIKKKATLASSIQHTEYLGGPFVGQDPVTLWQGSLSFRFLQGERGLLKLSTFDILRENIGINRSTDLNFLQEERIVTLNRYYMLSFSYSIVAVGKKN